MEMGEAAAPCLLRSVSQPFFASCEFKEGDPLRTALTTSISFGRFMTEPLDWERWSSFSHNRILEDVQKYSRPGVVAEKKAFFEAYYNKKSANKTAAKSPNKENKAPIHSSPQTNVTTNVINPVTISMNLHSSIDDTRVEQQEIVSNEDVCSPKTINVDDIISSTGQVEQETTLTEDVPTHNTNIIFSQFDHVDDDNVPSNSQVEREKASIDADNNKKKTHIKDAAASNEDKILGQTKPEISSLSRNGASYKLQSPRKAPTPLIKKTARDLTEDNKRSAPQSLHMSINFLPARNKNGTSKTISGKPKDRLIHQPVTRVSAVNNGVKKNSQELPKPENKRSKTVVNTSVNGSRMAAMKSLTTSACTKKPRSTITVPSSFSFRSEERAAKRKEFFQKLEGKGNTNEKQKIQLQQPKLKEEARSDNKKLRWSTDIEAKPSTSETKAPSNNNQKVPPTRHCSPKHGRKPTLVRDTCCQSPWRSSSSKPKNFIEINKKKLTSLMASLPTKKLLHDSVFMSKK